MDTSGARFTGLLAFLAVEIQVEEPFEESRADADSHRSKPTGKRLAGLSLAALGVVYGDIGTSPIYAIRESFLEGYGIAANTANVMGILSLIFWSLLIVITLKYLALVMRADNGGEGGIIALTALVAPQGKFPKVGTKWLLVVAGLFGASLLWGDSMITPAISVLSAVEGLAVAAPGFEPFVLPATIGILVGLFAFQHRGTSGIGAIFGPVTLVWFLTLAVLGIRQLVENPSVLAALSPHYAVAFFANNGLAGFLVLGAVFLVVTGGEALYADMGHFGTRPIRLTWFGLVLPALLLNYFGQGALILSHPEAIEHPFYGMVPEWGVYPLVGLATAATVIASQAVISGAFSLARQAVQLGYLPRLEIRHTSDEEAGQIYLPVVNWSLMIACIGLVIGFGSSSKLAAAYGVAVTTDMVVTTVLFAVVALKVFEWNKWLVIAMATGLLAVDSSFWVASWNKIPDGGWFPVVIAMLFFTVMTTWRRGRDILSDRIEAKLVPWSEFFESLESSPVQRVAGTAVYMHSNADKAPPALVDNLRHNHVIHERVITLTIHTERTPRVDMEDRVKLQQLADGVHRVELSFGFAEDPNVPRALRNIEIDGAPFEFEDTTFFLGREIIVPTDDDEMMLWRERLFSRMARNARRATAYFRLPVTRVVELATQVKI